MSQALAQLIEDLGAGNVRVVDLSVQLGPETPVIQLPEIFNQSPPLRIEEISRYDDRGPAWYWNVLHLGEHTGTHFDAPSHWVSGKDLPDNTTDRLPVESFVAPAVVLDFSAEAEADSDFLLEPSHIEAWEAEHGRIPSGAWVLFRTDWSKRITPEAFFNADELGPHTPGPSNEAVELLAHDRNVLGFGVETVGTDAGMAATFSPPFPCHYIMHGAGKYGLASLANLDQLPPTGSLVFAAPLKIVEGSGSPVRVLAIAPA